MAVTMDADLIEDSAVASEDMSAAVDYALVKAHTVADQVALCTAKTDEAIGCLLNKPASGKRARFYRFEHNKRYPVTVNAVLSVNDLITAGASAKGIANDAASGNILLGRLVEASGADGDVVGFRYYMRTRQ